MPSRGKVRERYNRSRIKLIELLPKLTELRVFYNTEEGDPIPKLLLHMNREKIVNSYDLPLVPQWAKPILQAAIKFSEET